MKNIKTFISLALAIFVTVWGSTQVASQSTAPKPEVVLMSEVKPSGSKGLPSVEQGNAHQDSNRT